MAVAAGLAPNVLPKVLDPNPVWVVFPKPPKRLLLLVVVTGAVAVAEVVPKPPKPPKVLVEVVAGVPKALAKAVEGPAVAPKEVPPPKLKFEAGAAEAVTVVVEGVPKAGVAAAPNPVAGVGVPNSGATAVVAEVPNPKPVCPNPAEI